MNLKQQLEDQMKKEKNFYLLQKQNIEINLKNILKNKKNMKKCKNKKKKKHKI